MVVILILLSAILFLSHSIFFLRALFSDKKTFRPKAIDKISRLVSMLLLIPTLISGSIVFKSPLLSTIIWIPVILIIASNFLKNWIKKSPYMLPFINMLFITLILGLSIREVVSL